MRLTVLHFSISVRISGLTRSIRSTSLVLHFIIPSGIIAVLVPPETERPQLQTVPLTKEFCSGRLQLSHSATRSTRDGHRDYLPGLVLPCQLSSASPSSSFLFLVFCCTNRRAHFILFMTDGCWSEPHTVHSHSFLSNFSCTVIEAKEAR